MLEEEHFLAKFRVEAENELSEVGILIVFSDLNELVMNEVSVIICQQSRLPSH